MDQLTDSDAETVCPYKGVARWYSLADGPDDVAWSYPEPFSEGTGPAGHLCFAGDDLATEVASARG